MWLSTNFFMPYLASRGDEITIVNTRQQKKEKTTKLYNKL